MKCSFSESDFPKADSRDLGIVITHLALLHRYTDELSACLDLVDHCGELSGSYEEISRHMKWQEIAAFYFVFTMYHFRQSVHALRERVRNTTSFKERFDFERIVKIADEFEERFPDVKHLRNAVGHQSDRMFKETEISKHCHGQEGAFVLNQIWNGMYIASHEGDIVCQKIDDAVVIFISALKAEIFKIFEVAE